MLRYPTKRHAELDPMNKDFGLFLQSGVGVCKIILRWWLYVAVIKINYGWSTLTQCRETFSCLLGRILAFGLRYVLLRIVEVMQVCVLNHDVVCSGACVLFNGLARRWMMDVNLQMPSTTAFSLCYGLYQRILDDRLLARDDILLVVHVG